MKRLLGVLALLLAACALPRGVAAREAGVLPLPAAKIAALLQTPPHGERIIMLWALDCAYCESTMQALVELQRRRPDWIELVFVDTDAYAGNAEEIDKRLRDAGATGQRAYAYASAATAQLNFLIDPDWGGETPRTLVLRADGSRDARSGALTATQLAQWLAP